MVVAPPSGVPSASTCRTISMPCVTAPKTTCFLQKRRCLVAVQLFLCLSRACLGKYSGFQYRMVKGRDNSAPVQPLGRAARDEKLRFVRAGPLQKDKPTKKNGRRLSVSFNIDLNHWSVLPRHTRDKRNGNHPIKSDEPFLMEEITAVFLYILPNWPSREGPGGRDPA